MDKSMKYMDTGWVNELMNWWIDNVWMKDGWKDALMNIWKV